MDTPPNVAPQLASSSGSQRSLMLAQGVNYYPLPPNDDLEEIGPAHSRCPNEADAAKLEKMGNADKHLSDISIAKVMALVVRQIEADTPRPFAAAAEFDGDETEGDADNEDDGMAGESSRNPSQHRAVALAGGSGSTLSRTSSKRRRSAASRQPNSSMPPFKRAPHSETGDIDAARHTMGVRRSTADFEKELLGVLECDVCAQLLYEPVTTPCQHVS